MRKRKFLINTMSALLNQIIMVVCAFILPRLILATFGSEVNGLISSIQQFLAVISFLELGVGAVVQAALYKPLAENDSKKISEIVKSASKFFTKLAIAMMIYVIGLLCIYPMIVNRNFSVRYIDTLILSMSISYFAQYFFGLKNQLLVIADQRGYIHYGLNSIALILNNIVGVLLIIKGCNIQFVKLSTSLILMIRPIVLEVYVRRHYEINHKIKYKYEPIKQKWNGVAQHIATVVLNSTDTIVLTLFSSLANVSIYNIYYLVINGLNNLVVSLTSSLQSLIGNMLSKSENELLNDFFNVYESAFHLIVTFLFGCVAVLITPFVLVYTNGVEDINYNVPVFAVLISIANLIYCLRLPYNTLIKAAGHFKETQNSAWLEMIINIVVSVISVAKFGLIGVSIGTLVAMLYRTIYLVWYLSQNIVYRKVNIFFKHLVADGICFFLILLISRAFKFSNITFSLWLILAVKLALCYMVICIFVNFCLFRTSFLNYKLILKKI